MKPNKGFRHYSQGAADAANRSYLEEERLRHKNLEELERKQIDLLKAQSEEQIRQGRNQVIHQRELNEQAAYNRDIQWLKYSDAEERLDYLLNKERVASKITAEVESLIWPELLQPHLQPYEQFAWSEFEYAFLRYAASDIAHQAALTKVEQAKQAADDAAFKASVAWILGSLCKFGMAFFGLVALWQCFRAFALLYRGGDGDSDVVGAVISAFCAEVLRHASRYLSTKHVVLESLSKDAAETHSKEVEPLGLLAIRQTCALQGAVEKYKDWSPIIMDLIEETISTGISDGRINPIIRNVVRDTEQQYPPKLRIDWERIPDALIQSYSLRKETEFVEVFRLGIDTRLVEFRIKYYGANLTNCLDLFRAIVESSGKTPSPTASGANGKNASE